MTSSMCSDEDGKEGFTGGHSSSFRDGKVIAKAGEVKKASGCHGLSPNFSMMLHLP